MKKLFIFLVLLLLVGCAEENESVSSAIPAKLKEKQSTMEAEIEVYAPGQSAHGFIVKTKERDKWAVVPASVVAQHPKALIVTSEGQQVEAKVVSYDLKENIAIIHFRNSANASVVKIKNTKNEKPVEIGKGRLENDTLVYTTFDKQLTKPVVVSSSTVETLLQQIKKPALIIEERLELAQAFQHHEKLNILKDDKISSYSKQTFVYNPDQVLHFTDEFHGNFIQYLTSGGVDKINKNIASDMLLDNISLLQEKFGKQIKSESFEFKNVVVADHQFVVSGIWVYEENGKHKESDISYRLIKNKDQLYIVSINLK